MDMPRDDGPPGSNRDLKNQARKGKEGRKRFDKNNDGLKEGTLARWKLYARMSNLGMVARRFFVANMTDGILTTLGVIIGFFFLFLTGVPIASNTIIVLPGLGTAVAMCISGVLASYLTESAERRKTLLDLRHDMVMVDVDAGAGGNKQPNEKNVKTLQEKAEAFAAVTASLINGLSPFVASIVVLIPFYFPVPLTLWQFLISIGLACLLLFLLGTYLARLSKMNIIVYGLKMVAMGLLTLAITYLLGFITG